MTPPGPEELGLLCLEQLRPCRSVRATPGWLIVLPHVTPSRFKLPYPASRPMSLHGLFGDDLSMLLTAGSVGTAVLFVTGDSSAGAFSICQACSLPGLHINAVSGRLQCHRCRAAALECQYSKLLEISGFTNDIKRTILWTAIRHPLQVFKEEARAVGLTT